MSDFWDNIDKAVSALAAEKGDSVGSWCLVRVFGQPFFKVVAKYGAEFIAFPPVDPHPVAHFLKSVGLDGSFLDDEATIAALESIQDASWTTVREPEYGWARGAYRRPASLDWREEKVLSHGYWRAVADGHGRPNDAWVSDLLLDLSKPLTSVSRRRVLGFMKRLFLGHGNWEEQSGISLRATAVQDPLWQDVLDQAGLGYDARVNGIPLRLAALGHPKGSPWLRILSGAISSRPSILELPLNSEDIPENWWNDKISLPRAPMWCWAARSGTSHELEVILSLHPNSVSIVDTDGRSALHWAASVSAAENINVLLAKGMDPSKGALNGELPEELVSEGDDALYDQLSNIRLGKYSSHSPSSHS